MFSTAPLWQPTPESCRSTLIAGFMAAAAARHGLTLETYQQLYDWSLQDREAFWSLLWEYCGVIGDEGQRVLLDGAQIEQAVWFPDARLNFAENLLRQINGETAIYFRAEDRLSTLLSWRELHEQVRAIAGWLREVGVGRGDRVAGYLPNIPETVVAMLATASLGAIWTSTSPDFGVESVKERFGQAEPKVLFAADGYFYGGRLIDIRGKVRALQSDLETIEQTVIVPLVFLEEHHPGLLWPEVLAASSRPLEFVPTGFNDPLYILYSSGTTGKPKCITHKVGGVLLQHLKELQLHCDVRPGDRVFYYTTCGWMMWNWLVSALACRAALVLYEGSPLYPGGNVLWDYAEEAGVTLFGTSAKYLDAIRKLGLAPKKTHDLGSLRTICSTGSVLAPESFDYVYQAIKEDVCLASISGGTDIVSCFVLGSPILPVYRGECQCRGLGMAVEVFDSEGNSLVGEKGELVCTAAFPSQPAFFWGDEDGGSYHRAYFATYPGVWHHGDYVELTARGGVIIHGRSDATLNPGGVRIGTAEIYRHVERLAEVREAVAIGQQWQGDVRIVLFVVLENGRVLDESLCETIRETLRENCSPRHVPAKIVAVPEIPRTKSGKIVEMAVRDVVHDRPVNNVSALANADALDHFRDLEVLRQS